MNASPRYGDEYGQPGRPGQQQGRPGPRPGRQVQREGRPGQEGRQGQQGRPYPRQGGGQRRPAQQPYGQGQYEEEGQRYERREPEYEERQDGQRPFPPQGAPDAYGGPPQARGQGPAQGQGQWQGRPPSGDDADASSWESPAGPLVRERRPPYRRESGQIAAVLLYSNGGHSVVWPDRREDHDRPMLRPPYTVFEVLLGRNVTVFDLALPAAGDAQFFDTRVEAHWEVEDPVEVVRKGVWDVSELLYGELLQELRQVSRRFRLTEAQRADEAIQDELRGGRIDLGRDLGLRLRIHVFVDLSDTVRRRKSEVEEIDLDMTRDEAQAEADRRREAAERRLVRERAAELEAVLRRGEEAEIISLMAKNPEKEWEIRQAIREERRQGQADFLNLFNRLLDTGHLERHDIGDQMYDMLQYLRESGRAVIGGVSDRLLTERPSRRELEAATRDRWRDGRDDDRYDSGGDGRDGRNGGNGGYDDRRYDRRPGGGRSGEDRLGVSRDGEGRDGEGRPDDGRASYRDRDPDRAAPGNRGGEAGRDAGDGWADDGWGRDRDRETGRDRVRGSYGGHAPEPERPPWDDDEPRVYRPTRVESGAERDRRERLSREEDRERRAERGAARRDSRPSADFDDWEDA
ncbi:hypothetical protein [Streptomyces sp. NRRL F-5135]|uniref:hypothetical protein n=1 Tax=Streptomyces sp. NRRL F-5135 TaxID=1463858 RepID=UPI00068B51C5|nr:hypothetical protein [Streptomyces sp. NRRL F-5135]